MINLTPHTVTVRDESGIDHVFPASGTVARVTVRNEPCAPLEDGTPTAVCYRGAAEIPEDVSGDVIVSTMFADAYIADGRVRLFVPDSGQDAIRENGQIVAVRRLIRR